MRRISNRIRSFALCVMMSRHRVTGHGAGTPRALQTRAASLLAIVHAMAAAQGLPPPQGGGGGGGQSRPSGGPPQTGSGQPGGGGQRAGGGGGGGMLPSGATQLDASVCGFTGSSCASDGSSARTRRSLTFDASTGVFSGFVISNACPASPKGLHFNGVGVPLGATPACMNQSIPAPAYMVTPAAAPLRGRVGLTARGGEDIYGPLDAGFTLGQACNITAGSCDAGTDIRMCKANLERVCGTARLTTAIFMDDCGGHAGFYHMHCHLSCEYNMSATSGHSPLAGLMLDGRGVYGMNEAFDAVTRTRVLPNDLDACGGHFGPVPATTIDGVTYGPAANVYHYHVQDKPPFLVGCYGPVSSLTQAKALYPTCTTQRTTVTQCTSVGKYTDYVLDCPVFTHGNESMNQPVVTSDCAPCEGACQGTWNLQSAAPHVHVGGAIAAAAVLTLVLVGMV